MDARLKDRLFYRAAPLAVLAAGLLVAAADYWEWRDVPKDMERGMAAFGRQDFAAAIRDFSKAQQHGETDILARLMLGASFHEYGWQDEALREYDTVVGLARDNGARAAHSAARIWASRRDYPNALRCFDTALRFAPDAAPIWHESGQACMAMGDAAGALRRFEQAAKLAPNNSLYRQETEQAAKQLQK